MPFDLDPKEKKAFEAYLNAVEGNGPQTTLFAILQESGVPLPAPEGLEDSVLTVTLWKVINALAEIGVYLDWTNHLSDRELYTLLWRNTLREDHPVVPEKFEMMTCIDILGGWSNEDIQTHLKYYADEEERRQFAAEWGDQTLPEHVDPPFSRDHLLPHPW
jgi:hypothetical protein